jgi:glycosyltransferase involved in cell wall biosynthesis
LERKTKILFTSTISTSFIKEDISFFENQYDVKKIIGSGLIHIIKIFFAVPKNDVTFTWFASVYSAFVVFFSRVFKKKSIIVIGGVDVAKEPSINYGIWLNWWKSLFVRYAIRRADKVLAVDPFLISEAKRLAKYDGLNLVYVPTGYDYNYWKPSGQKENFILSVGACEDEWRMMKKGFDKLIQAAALLPEVKFKIVGIRESLLEQIKKHIPHNVEIISFLEKNELLKYYQRAKVYCQVSFHEGLPNSLCEAMLCECIPVGTDRGGMPTAIGDVGLVVKYGNEEALIKAFKKSLTLSDEVGKKARMRIIENFPQEKRHRELNSNIKSFSV